MTRVHSPLNPADTHAPNSVANFAPFFRPSALPLSCAPRGLARTAAAEYVGISASKFDELVADGSMPLPKEIGRRRVWDRFALDEAFSNLAEPSTNPWDDAV